MKTLAFGALMGLFGCLAVFSSISLAFPGWVLFITWVCFYLFGTSLKKSANVYLQIVLGIGLGISIELTAGLFSHAVGGLGLYLAIFMLIGSLAFLTKIQGLNDIAAWFIGLIVFFGTEPPLDPAPVIRLLLLPLAAGFIFGYTLDTIVTTFVFGREPVNETAETVRN